MRGSLGSVTMCTARLLDTAAMVCFEQRLLHFNGVCCGAASVHCLVRWLLVRALGVSSPPWYVSGAHGDG